MTVVEPRNLLSSRMRQLPSLVKDRHLGAATVEFEAPLGLKTRIEIRWLKSKWLRA